MDYKSLKRIVLYHDKLYYELGAPVLPDSEYDALYDQLVEMEKLQNWKDPDSPTIRINSTGKIKHPYKLYSLNKIYEKDDIDPLFSIVTPKIDGVNLSVTYIDGNISTVLTRGNGEVGESVAHLSYTIKGIPKKVKDSYTYVGEVVTDNEDVTNFRNYVAGSLGLKSAKEASSRNLRFIVHDVLGCELDYLDRLSLANKNEFDTVLSFDCSKYPQDGIVYRVKTYNEEQNLGYTAKHPRFAVALKKKEHYSAITFLNDIEWVIGRSGVVTPVGIVETVVLDGANVSRVILHNVDFVLQNNLGRGDAILLERRITPQFVKVIEKSEYPRFTIDDAESALGQKLERIGPKLYTSKVDGYRLVEYFAKTLGLKGLGPASIRKLDVRHPSDLYKELPWHILGKNGEEIQKELLRPKDYPILLASLGIPGVGVGTAKAICQYIPSFKELHTIDSVIIPNIGEVSKRKILSWLESNSEWVEKLPYKLEVDKELESDTLLEAKKICITGKLDMTKSALGSHLKKYGYTVVDSVTKDCYALITNGDPSAKTNQAQKYGIPIINYWDSKKAILKGLI